MKRGGWDKNYKHTCPEGNKTLVVCVLGGMEGREELKGSACHVAVSKVEVHPGSNEGSMCVQAVYKLCTVSYITQHVHVQPAIHQCIILVLLWPEIATYKTNVPRLEMCTVK